MKSGYNVLCTFIYIVNPVVSGEIYTAGKNFTLPPAVTAVTNSTSISKEKEINIKILQSLNQNYGCSFKYQHLLSPDSTLALKWWERRGPLTTMSGLGNGWFSADNYCRLGGRTGKGGDEVFHSEFTQRSMVRYPQTTQHSSAALTDSLNFWNGADTTRTLQLSLLFLSCSPTTQSVI